MDHSLETEDIKVAFLSLLNFFCPCNTWFICNREYSINLHSRSINVKIRERLLSTTIDILSVAKEQTVTHDYELNRASRISFSM